MKDSFTSFFNIYSSIRYIIYTNERKYMLTLTKLCNYFLLIQLKSALKMYIQNVAAVPNQKT